MVGLRLSASCTADRPSIIDQYYYPYPTKHVKLPRKHLKTGVDRGITLRRGEPSMQSRIPVAETHFHVQVLSDAPDCLLVKSCQMRLYTFLQSEEGVRGT